MYYNQPLFDKIKIVKDSLLAMHKKGHLFIKYIIEDNVELGREIFDMVK